MLHSTMNRWGWMVARWALCGVIATGGVARAEVSEVRLAQQFGFASLPLMVMQTQHLVEKRLQQAGLKDTRVIWRVFSGGSIMNDALLSGNLDFAAGGVTPMLIMWDRTHGAVKGVASCGSVPLVLLSRRPEVKSVADFTAQDKIAVPAVKVSVQAVFLEMAAAKAFGAQRYTALDRYTVSMKHPDAAAAMMSQTEVTAHVTSSPFVEQELQTGRIHRVTDSNQVLGPATNVALYTTTQFHDANPKTYQAVLGALQDAMRIIDTDKQTAARSFVAVEQSKLPASLIAQALSNPENVYTATPQGFMKYAAFLHQIKTLKTMPVSWKDVFFPEIHDAPGN